MSHTNPPPRSPEGAFPFLAAAVDEVVTDERSGETFDFGHLYREHLDAARRQLRRMVDDKEEVEDLLQEAFLRVLRAAPTFRGEAQPSTFLYRVILNIGIDHQRRRSMLARYEAAPAHADATQENFPAPHPSPEKVVGERQLLKRVLELSEQLPHQKRNTLLLHALGLSFDEIAENDTVDTPAVRYRYRTAVAEVARKLEAAGHEAFGA